MEPQATKRIGLDDPRRVQKISNRGQEFLSPPPVGITSCSGSDEANIRYIECELDKALVECAINPQRRFVPHDKLLEIFTPGRVRQIVRQLPGFEDQDKDKIATEIYYGSENPCRPPSLKLLAALIGSEKSEDLEKHIADGINDSCFPLGTKGCDSNQLVYCKSHGKDHKTINEYHRPTYRENLVRWSYRLSAPFIKRRQNIHSHYILDTGDVFPIVSVHGSHSGGFSEVQKVKLHKSHFDLEGDGIRHPGGFFALKKLNPGENEQDSNLESFNMELASLLFSEDRISGEKRHLIQVLATFEVRNPAPQHPTWYFLFDWAEGDLGEFWKRHDHLVRDHAYLPWMAQQFHGLSKALRCVHNERSETLKSFDIQKKPNSNTLYGRHGDISVGNFLWFPSDPFPGVLSLADFGLGRLHRQVSRSERDPRSIARTATYRAPEFDLDTALISRKSDIFSLGCVFLEYIIWFFRGFEGVEKNSKNRLSPDIYGFDADTFFTSNQEATGKGRSFVIKQSVRDSIRELKDDPNCSTYLSELLDFIGNEMLQTAPSARADSVLLEREMARLLEECRNEGYYRPKALII